MNLFKCKIKIFFNWISLSFAKRGLGRVRPVRAISRLSNLTNLTSLTPPNLLFTKEEELIQDENLSKLFAIIFFLLIFGLNFNIHAEVHKMDIVVEASKDDSEIKDLPVGVQVITSEEIEKLNPPTVDNILNFQSGITEAGKQGEIGSNSTIRIRGNGANYSLVLLDGQPINSSNLGSADLSFISVDMIDRIEIIKGPYSTVLGNGAVGGVINIITKNGYSSKKTGGYIKAAAGSYGYNNLAGNSFFNQNKTSLAVNFDLQNYDGFRENSGYDSQNFFLKLNQEVSADSNFSFRYIYNTKNIGNSGSNPTAIKNYNGIDEKISITPNDKMQFDNHYLQTDYKLIKSELGEFNVRLYKSINISNDENPDGMDWNTYLPKHVKDYFDESKTGFEAKFLTENNLLAGYQLEYDEAKKDDKTTASNVYDYSRSINSVYLQKTIKTGDWTNIAGGRYDYSANYGEAFSPKLTSIFNLNANVRLSANIAKSFRILSFSEFGSLKNPSKYEDGWGGDFGVDFGLFNKKANLQLVYFMQDINNKISWVDWLNPKQVEESQSRGFETSMDFKTGIFDNTINYTYTDAKSRENTTSKYLRDMYVPYNKFSYIFERNLDEKILFDVALKYTGEQSWEDSYGSKYHLDEYWLTDFNLTVKFKKFDVYFSVDNIFDQDYQYRIGYPIPAREFRIGTKFKV